MLFWTGVFVFLGTALYFRSVFWLSHKITAVGKKLEDLRKGSFNALFTIMGKKLQNEELGRLSVEAFKRAEKLPLVVLLDNVRSAVNVGSVFRTADAFGIERILLSGITPSPDRKVRKTALGATESVDWERVEDPSATVRTYRKNGYRTHGIEQTRDAIELKDFEPASDEGHLLVLGHEVDGIGEEVLEELDDCLLIEQFGTKHSLNVSVCTGIVLWEFQKRLRGG